MFPHFSSTFPDGGHKDFSIPTIILTTDQVIINRIDLVDKKMVIGRIPYYAKVVYNNNNGTFADGSTANEKMLYQSDRFIYSTMEEAKQEFTFDAATILKDNPSNRLSKEGSEFVGWYLDEACTMPFDETSSVDFTTLADGTLQLYAGGYKEIPEEPEVKKEEASNTGDHSNQSMYYILLGGSVIVLGAMAYKHRKSFMTISKW